MGKVITFGELMLKLSPPTYKRLIQAHQLNVEYSGAEANVAVCLANFGLAVSFVTAVPDNVLGDAAINALRHYGVDVSKIIRKDGRIGIYFSEKGASQRPSKVIYDRKDSAIALATEADFDWDSIFHDATWFHFTGITPALSDDAATLCLAACKAAKDKGLTISCDLNYRSKLWNKEKANNVMTELCQYVDICIANEADAADVFGIKAEESDVDKGILNEQSYISVAQQLQKKFGFKQVAITLRESISASDNNWSAILLDDNRIYTSHKYPIHIVDRIGGGDSFGAGLIYAMMIGFDPQHALEFAVAASCLKQTIEGDFNLVTVGEVESLVKGNHSGRISR
ncbi:MAG: sugar kinase [Bacteroidales bacterium]|nr:sugar kinase [Bacteroidales bacterium]MBR6161292.1 sugar kinase [Bacteroidales bacterium]